MIRLIIIKSGSCVFICYLLFVKSRSYVLGVHEVATRREVLNQVEAAKEMVGQIFNKEIVNSNLSSGD